MTPLVAFALPDPGYLFLLAIVVAIVALIGIGAMLTWLRKFRAELGAELKREIGSTKESVRIDPPQPLIVKGHQEIVTRAEHETLARRMDEELGRERGARKKIHEEIGAIQSTVASIKTETDKQSEDISEVKQDIKDMNGRVDLVPERTINLLKTTGVIK